MAKYDVCPWWKGYLLASPLRRLWQDPARLLGPYVRPGMIVLEPGPGMGFFTLELARRVGSSGRVVALDIQPEKIEALRRRAHRAGLLDRIDARVVAPQSLELDKLAAKVDFTFAFAVVHETPSALGFFAEVGRAMKDEAVFFYAEPEGHVSAAKFARAIAAANANGFTEIDGAPPIKGSMTALLGARRRSPAEAAAATSRPSVQTSKPGETPA
jgi:SAM-dependent methyltransferase